MVVLLEGGGNVSNDFYGFFTSSQHQLSFQVHEEHKNLKCKYCNMEFRHNNSFKRHMMQHTGERPYECPHCHMAFKRKEELNAHTKKSHPEESRIAATVASATEDETTDAEAVPEKVRPPYLAPQPSPQPHVTQLQTPQMAPPQIITSAPQPQVIAAAQPFPALVQPQPPPPLMYTQVRTADGQTLLVPMENLTYAQPQPPPQPFFLDIQPTYETIEVLPPAQQLPVVVQQPQVRPAPPAPKPPRHVEVIDLSGSDDEDDPAPVPAKKNTLEIAMREITGIPGLEVKVEVTEDTESCHVAKEIRSTTSDDRPFQSPSPTATKSKSDMGTNTESSQKPAVLVKKEKCKDIINNNAPTTFDKSANSSTRELAPTATPPSKSAEETGPLECEDDDGDERGFKGEEIVDKSADLKRLDGDDHHSKSSPGGVPQIAEAAELNGADPPSEELRCERCGRVYQYLNFLKVHLRRCGI